MSGATSPELSATPRSASPVAGHHFRMTHDRGFMRVALDQAKAALAAGEVPVGAVVVKDGQVIAVGHNAPIASHDPSAHAEMVAIRAAARALGNYRLDGCELFVTLEPCAMCAGAMLHARLARVVYGARDPKTGAAGSALDLFANTHINHHTRVEAGVLADECAATLQAFFVQRRKARALQAQPLSEDALRTPASAFAGLKEYPFVSRYLEVGPAPPGWRMHYLDEGAANAAAAVLCVHDLPGWSYRFRHLIPALSNRGVRVIAPDLIGFGMSDKPKKDAVHTPALHLDSLERLVDVLQLSELLVLGEGASVGLARMLAHRRPHVVVQTRYLPSTPHAMAERLPYPDKGYQAAVRAAPGLLAQLASELAALPASADTVAWQGPADALSDPWLGTRLHP